MSLYSCSFLIRLIESTTLLNCYRTNCGVSKNDSLIISKSTYKVCQKHTIDINTHHHHQHKYYHNVPTTIINLNIYRHFTNPQRPSIIIIKCCVYTWLMLHTRRHRRRSSFVNFDTNGCALNVELTHGASERLILRRWNSATRIQKRVSEINCP